MNCKASYYRLMTGEYIPVVTKGKETILVGKSKKFPTKKEALEYAKKFINNFM